MPGLALAGLGLLRSARTRGNKVPVLILTARDALQDRIAGLDSGADAYVVKPTDVNELAARLRALVRQWKGEPASGRRRHCRGATRESRPPLLSRARDVGPRDGLGLSIVQRIVDRHRALLLDTPSTGCGLR